MKDVGDEEPVSDHQVFNALYRQISASHEFKKASGLKSQTYLQEWNDRETYYLLKGIYKHGENEWNEILCSFKFKDSRTPNCLAFKWRELKTVMVDEIERLKKEGVSLSHFEWLEAALKKLEMKLKPASISRKASVPQMQIDKEVKINPTRVLADFNIHQEAFDKILREYESKVATTKGLGHFGSFMIPTPNLTPQPSYSDRPRHATAQDVQITLTHANSGPNPFSQPSSNSNSNQLPTGNYQSSFVKRKNSDFTPIVGGMPGNALVAAISTSGNTSTASSQLNIGFSNVSNNHSKTLLPTYVISGANKFSADAPNSAHPDNPTNSGSSKPFQAHNQPINIKKLFELNSSTKTPKSSKPEEPMPSSPKKEGIAFQSEQKPSLISSTSSMSSSFQKSEPKVLHSVSSSDKQSIINNYYISNSIQMNNFVNQHSYYCNNSQQEKKVEEKKDKTD